MTDPSGDKDTDRPAADPTVAYDPPPPAEPPSYAPAEYDPPAGDATIADTTVADTADTSVADTAAAAAPEQPAPLPPGSFETPAAYIPGTPYAAPGQPQPVYAPPGYPQQPYPQYPSYVTPPQYPQPYGTSARGQDNALAIGALVCSILGFCSFVTAIAGLVMGHIALSKTNRGEAGGRGLATAAVIVGYVVIALWVGFLTTFIILGANGQLT
ncbi:hypothetical protein H4696_005679 [Amycolatopsis lexingtonensis]|uniref:DUF4190 domain-containing protein n=1 Tax=Amycolatopsis lexingtonensis TaxID=218822 RepID=A0ABR9I5Y4_9PSEU|nr:DUF4190 domain-containing protein [Amycolatopsis lexingtonensis]MBE1498579.1 hypothetical protein [Amycolatopsis lexingtonensis]